MYSSIFFLLPKLLRNYSNFYLKCLWSEILFFNTITAHLNNQFPKKNKINVVCTRTYIYLATHRQKAPSLLRSSHNAKIYDSAKVYNTNICYLEKKNKQTNTQKINIVSRMYYNFVITRRKKTPKQSQLFFLNSKPFVFVFFWCFSNDVPSVRSCNLWREM